jgi:hypothetical protein
MIYLIKLTSGEVFVAEMVSSDNDKITVKNPVVYHYIPDTGKLAVIPWLFPAVREEQELDIYKSHIVVMCKPDQTYIDHYKNLFGQLIIPEPTIEIPQT